ncbi:amidohydrolase [Deinococcus oregonensis]|uniref:Amidohydrolase n=1 Tax=Deinococcus oregonensis TaxID=1805970 RepID=A0ABV6B6P7_9DEIO
MVSPELLSLMPQVVAWRRHLHQYPELSHQEHATAAWVDAALRALPDMQVFRPTPTSVLGVLQGQAGPGATVLLRADLDALPIQEQTQLPYASVHAGVMHACGHDGHTAALLGAAHLLHAQRHLLRGELRLLFQHAEEAAPSGARELVSAGVMGGVDRIVGFHLDTQLPLGRVAVQSGAIMAAPDTFEITVQGQGGHAGWPQASVDPVPIGAMIVLGLQQVASRLNDPLEPLVLSITTFHAGQALNVTPDQALLGGTVRTLSPVLRERVETQLRQITASICAGYGASCTVLYERGSDAVVNDAELVKRYRQLVEQELGESVLMDVPPEMGAEDFSEFLRHAPGVYFLVGAGNAARGITAPHHHPRFTFDEEALTPLVQLLVAGGFSLTGEASSEARLRNGPASLEEEIR